MEQGPFIENKFKLSNIFEKFGILQIPKAEVNWEIIRDRLKVNPKEAEGIFKNTFGDNAYQKLVEQLKVNPALMADIREHVGIISDEILEQFKAKETTKTTDEEILDAIKEEIIWRLISEIAFGIISSL